MGTGVVARALGIGFATTGHDVKFGTREPAADKVKQLVAAVGARASAGTLAEAAQFAEVAVLATAWGERRTPSASRVPMRSPARS